MLFLTKFPKRNAWGKRFLIGEYLNNIWQSGLDLLFPSPALCSICGRKLSIGALLGLCQSCLEHMPWVGAVFCQLCGRPLAIRQRPSGEARCSDCTRTQHFFVRNRAIGIYTGSLKEQIQELKYRYNRQLGIDLGQILGLVAKHRQWVPKTAHLLAVPLYAERLRQRGYNQAELLLDGLQDFLQVPALEPGTVIRRSATGASSHLGPRARRANLQGVFQVPRPGQVAGKVLCVIDDIYTTGATLDELTRTLLQAGAQEVYGLTLSIAVDEQDLLGHGPSFD